MSQEVGRGGVGGGGGMSDSCTPDNLMKLHAATSKGAANT